MRRRRRQRRLLAAAGSGDASPSTDLEAGKAGPSGSGHSGSGVLQAPGRGSIGSLQSPASGSRSLPDGSGSDTGTPTGDADGVQELAELWAAAARAGQGQSGQPGGGGMKLVHLTGSSPQGR